MKKIVNISLLAAVVTLASCADWVEPRPLGTTTPSLEEQNPELYEKYINNLIAYKSSDHRVVMVAFDNPKDAPANQSQRLTALPDSVDIVALNNPAQLHETTAQDIAAVHKKGTRVIMDVNFPAIEKAWSELARENAALTEADALKYISERTAEAFNLCVGMGLDGVTFTYAGRASAGMGEAELKIYEARQNAFFAVVKSWNPKSNGGFANYVSAFRAFVGNPQFLTEANRAILKDCDYIVLPTELATDVVALELAAQWAAQSGVPTDRFMFRTYMADPADPNQANGYSGMRDDNGNRLYSVAVNAAWMNRPHTGFEAHGMMILGAQVDYYSAARTYAYTRAAIRTMNP